MTPPSAAVRLGSLVAVALTGCAAPSTVSSDVAPIERLVLLTSPTALNFDQRPGVDGFAVKIYAFSRDVPRPLAITSGVLEVMLFDGVLAGPPGDTEPRIAVRHEAADLARRATRSVVGIGYTVAITWKDARELPDDVTLIARHESTSGRVVYSTPLSIAMRIR